MTSQAERDMMREREERNKRNAASEENHRYRAKLFQKDYPMLNIDKITAVVRQSVQETWTPQELTAELTRLATQHRTRESLKISDELITIWLQKFPSLETDQVRNVLRNHLSDRERELEFKKLVKQQQKKKFDLAKLMLDEEVKEDDDEREYDFVNNTSTNDDDDDNGDNSGQKNTTASVPPVIKQRLNDDDESDAALSSLWHTATERQRKRMLGHYCHEYPLLNERGVQQILENAYDLPAAEATMERHARNREEAEIVNHAVFSTKDRRAQRAAAMAEADRIRTKETLAAAKASNKTPKATVKPISSSATNKKEVQQQQQEPSVVAAAVSSPKPGTAEYEINFFSEMFENKIPLAKISDVLSRFEDTEKRMEVLGGMVAKQEQEQHTNKTDHNNTRSSDTTTAGIEKVGQRLDSRNREVEEYQRMFPQLSRHQINDAIDNSTDAVRAMMRICERQQQETENQQQQKKNDDEEFVVVAEGGNEQRHQQPEGISYKECVVCMEKVVTHICIPCGHYCLCAEDAARIEKAGGRNCPVCRDKFVGIFRVY